MNRRLVIGALTALALLAGCSDPPESGYIYQKQYSAPYDWVQMVCAGYDKNGLCTMNVPIMQHEPAHWRLCLVDDKKADLKGCREVDPHTFDRYERGNHYPDPR
jgi:hypothetical protein